ncbi:MAG: hypothetical protein ACYDCO_10900 [Armatimonadota bacterium]
MIMQTAVSRGFVSFLCLLAFALAACAGVHIGKAEFGYYAPQIHEMYLKLPVTVDPAGENEKFFPNAVLIDGKRAPYIYFYFNGTTVDFSAAHHASKGKIELFVPVHWKANAQHEVSLCYTLNDAKGEETVTLPTPKTGGAWDGTTDNIAFLVREEAGLARVNEPVDFDLTVEQDRFPEPEKRIRATVMTAPGVFTEIPCQVYDVQAVTQEQGMYSKTPLFRFRAIVQLTVKTKSQALVHLWTCPPRETPAGPITLNGGALGGTVSNDAYEITLDETCGQFHTWRDKRLGVTFEYKDTRKVEGQQAVIHRTPDLYRANKSWTHALDWDKPANRSITGPVMVETIRWGEMPWVPEAFSKVDYRFFANRPEIRAISSMRIVKDIEALGVRMGGFILTPSLFTHIAWPEQDGTIRRCTVPDALGNDMGAPPQSRFPVNTPWVVVYHQEKNYGFALITANYAYFSDGPGHANESRSQAYVSNYRGFGVYSIRSSTQTYCAHFRSFHTPVEAGTTMYEDVAYLPFTYAREDKHQFDKVWALWKEMRNPLVIVP